MTVHVGEIHTDLTGAGGHQRAIAEGAGSASEPRHPGAVEDQWRSVEARVEAGRRRVCAEDFDD